MRKLDCIMLIDDNKADNYLHEMVLAEAGCAERIVAFEAADRALAELEAGSVKPNLILLDINMPRMTGWEFLEAYARLPVEKREAFVMVMLTTSLDPEDRKRAEQLGWVDGYYNKPLTTQACYELIRELFPDSG